MVKQHYRWDFIQLSTDEKPTPETSEKVTDGSTFYCSDTSKLYVYCKDNWYERKPLGGGGGGTTYTAGDGIDITDDTISVDTDTIQEKLTAGTNITISDNVISASGGGGVIELTSADYNYPSDNPTSIAVWLLDDGIYSTKSAGVKFDAFMNPAYSTSFIVVTDSSDNKYTIIFNNSEGGYIRQTGVNATDANRILTDKNIKSSTGTSTKDVMSQKAVTDAIASSGGGVKTLTSADYNYPAQNPQGIAFWLLDEGQYITDSSVTAVYPNSTSKVNTSDIYSIQSILKASSSHKGVYLYTRGEESNTKFVTTINPNGTSAITKTIPTQVSDVLTSTSTTNALSANQGKVLKDTIDARVNTGADSPTTSTVGVLGQLYTDTTNMHTYQCTAISGDTYTWTQRW